MRSWQPTVLVLSALGFLGVCLSATADESTPMPPGSRVVKEPAIGANLGKTPDQLPDGAVMRIGSVRFSHPGGISCIRFLPDGNSVVTAGNDSTIRFWDAKTGKETKVLGKPADAVGRVLPARANRLEVSRDGKFLAYASVQDRELKVWDIEKGKEVNSFAINPVTTLGFAINHDGSRVAIPDVTGKLTIWDAATKKEWKSFAAFELPVGATTFAVAFGADGKSLVTGGGDLAVKLWTDLDKAMPTATEIGSHRDFVASVAISDDGKRIVSYGMDGKVRVWDAVEKKALHKFDLGENPRGAGAARNQIASVQISADGGVACGCSVFAVGRYWSVETGTLLGNYSMAPSGTAGGNFPPYLAALSADGLLAATASTTGQIDVYELKTGKRLSTAEGHSGGINLAVVSPNGKLVATGGVDATVRLWDFVTGKHIHALDSHVSSVNYLRFTDDSKHLFSASADPRDRAISTWDVKTGQELKTIPGHTGTAAANNQVAVSPDGKYLAVSGQDLTVRVREIAENKEVFKTAAMRASSFAFTDDGKFLTVLGTDVRAAAGMTLTRISVPEGVSTPMPNLKLAQVFCQGLSRDGRFAVMGINDGSQKVVDLQSGREIRTIGDKGVGMPVRVVRRATNHFLFAFSADNRVLAGPGPNDSICVWELATGAERRRFTGHQGAVVSTCFSPDGNKLVTAAADNTVLVWDLGYLGKEKPAVMKPDELWNVLAGDDSAKAYTAILQMLATPKDSVELIAGRLKPTVMLEGKQIEQLVADLDSEDFAVRKASGTELQKLGEIAEPFLRKALENKPPLEVKQRIDELLSKIQVSALTGDQLRGSRCIELLEKLATAESKAALEKLAKGPEGDKFTKWARESLERMNRLARQ